MLLSLFIICFICAVWSIDGTKAQQITESYILKQRNSNSSGYLHGTFCDDLEQCEALDNMGRSIADKLLAAGARNILNPEN